MARSAIPAVLRRLADAAPVDGDTEDHLREAADRLEQCEDEALQVIDAIAAAELELREHTPASGGDA
jgi:hypothetical protein